MKMYDVGESYSESELKVEESGSKNKKYYPHIDLSTKNFPEIEKMKVGKKYVLTIEVKPIRFSINESAGSEKKASMCFEVSKIGMSDDNESEESGENKVNNIIKKMYNKK